MFRGPLIESKMALSATTSAEDSNNSKLSIEF